MHKLISFNGGGAANPTSFAENDALDTSDHNIQDAVGDLSELEFLIDDIERSLGSETGWVSENLRETISTVRAKHSRYLDLVERAGRWGSTKELDALLSNARQEYLSTKSTLRAAYRYLGTLLCANDWQSPIYASSLSLELNRLSDGISEHNWDYKRDGHLDSQPYEAAFIDQYVSHLGSANSKAYVMNSGMAGFTTVLNWLAHEMNYGDSVVAMQPMYFENLHLARGMFPQLIQINAPVSSDELLVQLRTELPSIVITDVVSNCGEVLSQDVETVLRWARVEAKHRVAIIIDTTCMPAPLLASGLLAELPDNASVFLIESLAKHHQFGMDTVTGGVVVACMSNDMHSSFGKTRARLGTNISDTSIGSLPQPNRQKLVKRMQRHSRNTRLVCEGLIKDLDGAVDGVLDSVSWLNYGTGSSPWFRGTCLTVRFKKPFRSIQNYKLFEQIVLDLCKEAKHPIAFGTSFGFDLSRLYVTAPATRFEEPFLRVSVGTETYTETLKFVEILNRASVETLLKATPKETESRQTKAPLTFAPKPSPPIAIPHKSGLRSSVFLGANGLKDYLSPANYAPAPLVELPSDLNPFANDGVRIFAKIMPLVPLMNIKSIPAFSMLNKAAERGQLEGVKNIIESSSSNTVLSLSVIAKLFEIDTTCAIVDHSIAPSLVRMLRLFGIEIFLHPSIGHELFGKMQPRSERAVECGSQPGWLNPGQYSNLDNPEGFERWLAPDLWRQTEGRINLLSCALGTCGTMVGVSRGLRERNADLQVLACCPEAGHAVPGPRERSLLGDVTFKWQDVANSRQELTSKESFTASIKLLRRGIMGGPSSGMNYAGLLRHLEEEKASGRLEQHVKENGEMWCVFLCCDSPLPHVEEYFHTLGDESFPTIHPVPELKTEETSKIDATVESTAALTGGSETISETGKI